MEGKEDTEDAGTGHAAVGGGNSGPDIQYQGRVLVVQGEGPDTPPSLQQVLLSSPSSACA